MIEFTIKGNFPSLNQTLASAMKNYHKYSKLKKDLDSMIRLQIRQQKVPEIKEPVAIIMQWYVKNKKVDPDNTFSVTKYILDALQDRYTYYMLHGKRKRIKSQQGVWKGDGFKEFPGGIIHTINVDEDNPRVEVSLLENVNFNDHIPYLKLLLDNA